MQDWPLEVADSDRIEEFLAHYQKEGAPERRLAIAALLAASLDEAFSVAAPPKQLLDRLGPVFKAYPDLVEYWSCPDAHTDDEMFAITPWIRGL